MQDNFEQIKGLLKFDNEDEFYFLQVIQRKKDNKENNAALGTSNNSRLIKAYYIYSVEQLDKYTHEIKELCKLFNARAGINLNRRNAKQMSLEMMALLATNIKNSHYSQLSKLYSTVCGQHHAEKDKLWIVDIDHKNRREINEYLTCIERECEPIGNKYVALIESNAGFHLITTSFNSKKFNDIYPGLEIHKNNPTNLYIP